MIRVWEDEEKELGIGDMIEIVKEKEVRTSLLLVLAEVYEE